MLATAPDLAYTAVHSGATRQDPDEFFLTPTRHAVYRGNTALVIADLIEHGADPRAASKRGSTPLHLAVRNTGRNNSGSDASQHEQARIITVLLRAGARSRDTRARRPRTR